MWLINVVNRQLELHNDERILPPYAILSHTWSGAEVSMQEYRKFVADGCVTIQKGTITPGLSKIQACCAQADKDKLSHLWIDTCCIDKTSSAELSEAINSMFRWYKNAEICYVYLEDIDVSALEGMPVDAKLLSQARWFTRGWTLQELLAPQNMVFFDKNWMRIGTKVDKIASLALLTGIDQAYLTGADLNKASIAKRMYWAARRATTKVEDMAYSLLGLFDINMPLLYGEGAKAFTRLQEEILKETDDQSLFAWEPRLTHSGQVQHLRNITLSEGIPIFARHPREFFVSHDMAPCYSGGEMAMVGGKGLKIELPLFKTLRNADIQSPLRIAVLDWTKWRSESMHDRIGIVLHKICSGHFMRHPTAPLTRVKAKTIQTRDLRTVYIRKVINDKIPSPSNAYLPHFNQTIKRNRRIAVTRYLPQTWPQNMYLRKAPDTLEGDTSTS